jgi:putative ABC transport system substrate-binding protein
MNAHAYMARFVAALVLAIVLAPVLATAQSAKVPRIGILRAGAPPDPNIEGFRQGLRELGYIEGKNVIIEYRWAEGKVDRLAGYATELVRLNVDVIFTGGTQAVHAATNATSTIPIVTGAVGGPEFGFVTSFARPSGNLTGMAALNEELSGKKIDLIKQVVPAASRIAILGIPGGPSYEAVLKETRRAARLVGVELEVVEVRDPSELESAFARMTKARADALITVPDEMFFVHRQRIVDLAAKSRLPGLYDNKPFVDAGGLMAYGPSFPELFRRAATYVDKILKGAKPRDLPIERPTHFELVVNLKTAKALGLTIPSPLLARADQVIE